MLTPTKAEHDCRPQERSLNTRSTASMVDLQVGLIYPSSHHHLSPPSPSLSHLAPNHGHQTIRAPPLFYGCGRARLGLTKGSGTENDWGDPGRGRPKRCVINTGQDSRCVSFSLFWFPYPPLTTPLPNSTSTAGIENTASTKQRTFRRGQLNHDV